MIDTIKLYLRTNSSPDVSKLTDIKTHKVNNTIAYYSGRLKNLYIKILPYEFRLRGSLSEYFYENNIKALTYQDFCDCIADLSKIFDLPLERATITQLDININIHVKYQPAEYSKRMIRKKYCSQKNDWSNNQSIYFMNKCLVTKIYDKVAQQKRTEKYKNKNFIHRVLRIEHRLQGRNTITSRLKLQNWIIIEDLLDDKIFMKLYDVFYYEYMKIEKHYHRDGSKYSFNSLVKLGDVFKYYAAKILKDPVEREKLETHFDILSQSGVISKQLKWNNRNKIEQLVNQEYDFEKRHNYSRELDNKVNLRLKYERAGLIASLEA